MRNLVAGVVGFLTFVLVVATSASGQVRDFEGLRLRPGDRVVVIDRTTGDETTGRVSAVSAAAIVVEGRVFTPRVGLTIARLGDPVWEGVVIGAGVGAIVGVTIGAESCLHRPIWRCAVTGGALYALLGAAIDGARAGETTVYRSNVSPVGLPQHGPYGPSWARLFASGVRVTGTVSAPRGAGLTVSGALTIAFPRRSSHP